MKRVKNKDSFQLAEISKRCFAFVFDWYVGTALSYIPIALMWNILTKEETLNFDLTLFPNNYGIIAAFLALLVMIGYHFGIPLMSKGQTWGHKLLNIQIVSEDGSTITNKNLFMRQVVGLVFLESSFFTSGEWLRLILVQLVGASITNIVMYIFVGIFLISLFMTIRSPKAQSLHDRLAGSIVINKIK